MQRNNTLVMSHEDRELTLELLASHAGIHPRQLQRFVECGLVHSVRQRDEILYFDASEVPRLRMINRLREVLGVNVAGIEVVLNLLERLRALRRENESLRHRL